MLDTKFSFKHDCLFCGRPAKYDGKRKGYNVYSVRTIECKDMLAEICLKRGDVWADQVKGRLEYCNDLHASDAVYHHRCNINFRTNRDIPETFQRENHQSAKRKRGRPTDSEKEEAFLRVVRYLEENDDEQITIGELVSKMEECCGEDSYTPKYMKKRVIEHLGDDVIITEINGKPIVVTFHSNAASILHKFYERPKQQDDNVEKLQIIETAANLIKNDIKVAETSKINYPLADDISPIEQNLDLSPLPFVSFLENCFLQKTVT